MWSYPPNIRNSVRVICRVEKSLFGTGERLPVQALATRIALAEGVMLWKNGGTFHLIGRTLCPSDIGKREESVR